MKVNVRDILGHCDVALGIEPAKLLFEAASYALEQPRKEKVVLDFNEIKEMDAEFLAYGVIALMDVYTPQDLANNLDFEGLSQYHFNLLKKIGNAWLSKKRDVVDFMAYCREASF